MDDPEPTDSRSEPWAGVDASGRPSTIATNLPDPDPISPTRTRPAAYLVEPSGDR